MDDANRRLAGRLRNRRLSALHKGTDKCPECQLGHLRRKLWMLARCAALLIAATTAIAASAVAVPLHSAGAISDDSEFVEVPLALRATLFGPASQSFPVIDPGDQNFSQDFYTQTYLRERGASSSVFRGTPESTPAGGGLLTFFAGSDRVAIFTEDQAFTALLAARNSATLGEGPLPLSVYQEVERTGSENWFVKRVCARCAEIIAETGSLEWFGAGVPLVVALVLVFFWFK